MITKTTVKGLNHYNGESVSQLTKRSELSKHVIYGRLTIYFNKHRVSPYETLEELITTPVLSHRRAHSKGCEIKRYKIPLRNGYKYGYKGKIMSTIELVNLPECVVDVQTLRRRITTAFADNTDSSLEHLMTLPLNSKRKVEIINLPFELTEDEKLLNDCMHVNPGYKMKLC